MAIALDNRQKRSFNGVIRAKGLKMCWTCSTVKPLCEFGRNRCRADGMQYQCRDCNGEMAREWRAKNPEAKAAQSRKYLEANPDKRSAQIALGNAVRDGRVGRPGACSACGLVCIPQGHHPDYGKPLEVAWLCHGCHMREHRQAGEG